MICVKFGKRAENQLLHCKYFRIHDFRGRLFRLNRLSEGLLGVVTMIGSIITGRTMPSTPLKKQGANGFPGSVHDVVPMGMG